MYVHPLYPNISIKYHHNTFHTFPLNLSHTNFTHVFPQNSQIYYLKLKTTLNKSETAIPKNIHSTHSFPDFYNKCAGAKIATPLVSYGYFSSASLYLSHRIHLEMRCLSAASHFIKGYNFSSNAYQCLSIGGKVLVSCVQLCQQLCTNWFICVAATSACRRFHHRVP